MNVVTGAGVPDEALVSHLVVADGGIVGVD